MRKYWILCTTIAVFAACKNNTNVPGKQVAVNDQDSLLDLFSEVTRSAAETFSLDTSLPGNFIKVKKWAKGNREFPAQIMEWAVKPIFRMPLDSTYDLLVVEKDTGYSGKIMYAWLYEKSREQVKYVLEYYHIKSDRSGSHTLKTKIKETPDTTFLVQSYQHCEMIDYEYDDKDCVDSVFIFTWNSGLIKPLGRYAKDSLMYYHPGLLKQVEI